MGFQIFFTSVSYYGLFENSKRMTCTELSTRCSKKIVDFEVPTISRWLYQIQNLIVLQSRLLIVKFMKCSKCLPFSRITKFIRVSKFLKTRLRAPSFITRVATRIFAFISLIVCEDTAIQYPLCTSRDSGTRESSPGSAQAMKLTL